ncbi:MAG: type VI secretion system baseplate subunit TssG [Planctomycetota bacterium]
MAAEARWQEQPLVDHLVRAAATFNFFQAVRLLQAQCPDAVPVGHQGPSSREAIRFRPDLSLGFAASDIAAIRRSAAEPSVEIATTFLSLYGSSSPLPAFYTEDLLGADEESLVRAFLDLFHHRLLSLFYRAWEKYRYAVRFERGGVDPISRGFLAMLGLPAGSSAGKGGVSPVRLLAGAGLWTQQPHSAASLRGLLADYFADAEIEIEQCVGRWLDIAPEQRNTLGSSNCALGLDVMLGERVFDRSTCFRIHVGPLLLARFQDFLPNGTAVASLQEIVRLFEVDGLDYELELHLQKDQVPELALSSAASALGWSSWLVGTTPDADQCVRFEMRG